MGNRLNTHMLTFNLLYWLSFTQIYNNEVFSRLLSLKEPEALEVRAEEKTQYFKSSVLYAKHAKSFSQEPIVR